MLLRPDYICGSLKLTVEGKAWIINFQCVSQMYILQSMSYNVTHDTGNPI